MQKNIWKISMWIAMAISGFSSQQLSASECTEQSVEGLCQEELHDSESTFLASPDDLYIDRGNIMLNVEGFLYSVHSLKKVGGQWLASIDNNVNYCQRGHLTCRGCGLCHKPDCWYYIQPCKLWDRG